MPISASAFGDQSPAEPTEPKDATAAQGAEAQAPAEDAKPKRRTKKQMLEDAVIPGDDEQIKIKLIQTGEKVERTWPAAVELVSDGKAEFIDKALKYAVEKMEAQKGAEPQERPLDQVDVDGLVGRWTNLQEQLDETKASDTEKISALSEEAEMVRQQIITGGGTDPASDEGDELTAGKADTGIESGKKGEKNVPPDAAVGDEVVIGAETYRVGHGGVLVQGVVGLQDGTILHPQRRWKHVLGSGGKEWESEPVAQKAPKAVVEILEREVTEQTAVKSGQTIDGLDVWKVSMGYLEKIGLPEYSSLQIGPASAQHQVVDDGRRVSMTREDGTVVEIPAAVVEGMQRCAQVAEYVMRAERSSMVNFLEAVKPGSTQGS